VCLVARGAFSAQFLTAVPRGAHVRREGLSRLCYGIGAFPDGRHCVPCEFHSFHAGNLEVISGRASVRVPAGTPGAGEPGIACGPVLIGEDAIIEPGARLYGPAVIGPAAVVSAGSQVVASVVFPGGRVPGGMLAAHGVFGDPAGVTTVMMRYRDGWSCCPGRLITTAAGGAPGIRGSHMAAQDPAA